MRRSLSLVHPVSLLIALTLALSLIGCAQLVDDTGNSLGNAEGNPASDTINNSEGSLDAAPAIERNLSSAAPKPGSRQLARPLVSPEATPATDPRPESRPVSKPTPTLTPWQEAAAVPRKFGGRVTPPTPVDFLWIETNPMTSVRVDHQVVSLSNGTVMVVGGTTADGTGQRLASAEIYNHRTELFTPTGSMSSARAQHSATLLENGEVLVAGGIDKVSENYTSAWYLASAELYDPANGDFRPTGSLATGRIDHTATVLDDGSVLVVGGQAFGTNGVAEAEIYDPNAGSFSSTDSLANERYRHTATRLDDGRVLILGGRNRTILKSSEIYDPSSGTFSMVDDMAEYRYSHTATLLPSGQVLVVGGYGGDNNSIENPIALNTAELYDPTTNSFTSLTPMSSAPLTNHSATLLGNNQVLLVGTSGCNAAIGDGPMTPCGDAYIYDIRTETFLHLWGAPGEFNGLMNVGRTSHRSALLPNGNVLITGGQGGPIGPLASAEIFFLQD